MLRICAIALTMLAIAGCASTPHNPKAESDIPRENVVDQAILDGGTDKGEISIARDSFFVGGGVDTRFFVDGKRVVNIPNGDVFRFFLPVGQHRVGPQLYGLNTTEAPVKYEELDVKAGQFYPYRLFFNGNTFELVKLY